MKLKRSFYMQDTIVVAKGLLGCILVHRTLDGIIKGIIVEIEAYLGPNDKGAHSYGGMHTPPVWILFTIHEDLLIFFNFMGIIIVLML